MRRRSVKVRFRDEWRGFDSRKHAGVAQRQSAYTPTFASSTLTGPIEGRLSAHNGEDTGSKPVAGIISNSTGLQNLPGASSPHTFNRHGAEAARGAHNSEDTGSKPVAGILQFACFKEVRRHSSSDVKHEQPLTGMAQRQRAGLITPRSPDRNGLPVFYNSRALKKYAVIARAT